MTGWGPFETRDEASHHPAVREIHEKRHQWTGPVTRETREADEAMISALILGACDEAGVTLGAYDRRIVEWLSGWEPEVVAVIAGLIRRTAAQGNTKEETGDA